MGKKIEVGNSLEEHMIEMIMNPADESECFNCCKEFDSIVKCSANLVLWCKGVIGGEFLSFAACCEICHHELVEANLGETNPTHFFNIQDIYS